MGNKIFFDTNVILDIIDPNHQTHKYALETWERSAIEEFDIVISEEMLSTIFYINEDKRYVLEFFQYIQEKWHVVPFGKRVIENAINLSLEKNLDLEDVLQCLCAKENGCDVLITNDKRFYDCGIKIATMEAFLSDFDV